jgi:hypothetical protein
MKPFSRLLGAAVLALLVGSPAAAEDKRPQDMPYATSGELPQLSPDYKMTNHRVVLITDQS